MYVISDIDYRKGTRLIFLDQEVDIFCGNTTEFRDAGGSPEKSSLFFLTTYHPGIRLSGERVKWLVKCFKS